MILGDSVGKENNIIEFPKLAELRKQIEKLKTEISMLVLEKDRLYYNECRVIEAKYLLELGTLEYEIYKLECEILRVKRKIQLIQAKKNRQENIDIDEIEITLDIEFEEYKKKLDEKVNKLKVTLDIADAPRLSIEESKELKKIYRLLIKSIHPDTNPNITEEQLKLFQQATSAYERGDLNAIQIIWLIVCEKHESVEIESKEKILEDEKQRLEGVVVKISESIEKIKNSFPYNVKDLVFDKEKLIVKKKELGELLERYKEMKINIDIKLNDILG